MKRPVFLHFVQMRFQLRQYLSGLTECSVQHVLQNALVFINFALQTHTLFLHTVQSVCAVFETIAFVYVHEKKIKK